MEFIEPRRGILHKVKLTTTEMGSAQDVSDAKDGEETGYSEDKSGSREKNDSAMCQECQKYQTPWPPLMWVSHDVIVVDIHDGRGWNSITFKQL